MRSNQPRHFIAVTMLALSVWNQKLSNYNFIRIRIVCTCATHSFALHVCRLFSLEFNFEWFVFCFGYFFFIFLSLLKRVFETHLQWNGRYRVRVKLREFKQTYRTLKKTRTPTISVYLKSHSEIIMAD